MATSHPPGRRPRKLLALRSDPSPLFPGRTDVGYGAAYGGARLTESPVTTFMYSQRPRRVTKGRSWRSSSSSFLVFSSSFGRDPGLFYRSQRWSSPLGLVDVALDRG